MSDANLKMTFRPVPVPPVPTFTGTGLPKNIDDVAEALNRKIPDAVKSTEKSHKGDPFVVVGAEQVFEVLKFLRDDERFLCTMLQVISATDYKPLKAGESAADGTPAVEQAREGWIEVLYVLWSFQHRHQILVKVKLDRSNPRIPTVCDLWRAANWYERECWDLLGVIFEGHPDHSRILLPPDWVGHPLRRDYVFPEEYNGMKVPL